MSTDQIFAAQMWSWADPMIKRDSHGRILIVNAAFLQLYGGTIESWTGSPIQGWPNPQSPGEVAKFESRIPLPTGGETVYDWMECTQADGTAIAMARDVSAYAQMPVPQPVAQPAAQPPAQAAPAMEQAAPQQQLSQAEVSADLASLSPVQQFAAPAQPVQEAAPVQAPVQSQPPAEPAQLAPQAEQPAPVPQAQPAEQHAVVAPLPLENMPPAPQAAAPESQQEETRDFERRALPIENGDAILGNNWRDAVIAKAVGVEDNAEAASPAPASTPAQPQSAAPAPASQPPSDKVRVLLAEDNAINALLTRTLLEAEGCLCDVVEDGVLAVEAIKNNDYKMVFMDMRMPNMDGLEATRKIRSMGYGADILPIVALTANAFDDDRNACFDSGMNDFMTKPVSAEELSAMVTAHTSPQEEKKLAS